MESIGLKVITGFFVSASAGGGGYAIYKNKDSLTEFFYKENKKEIDTKDEQLSENLDIKRDVTSYKNDGHYFYNNSDEKVKNDGDYAYAVVQVNHSTNKVENTNLFNEQKKNFQCHSNKLIDRGCEIQKIDLSKNHYTFNDAPFISDNTINKEELEKTGSLFLLKTHKSLITAIESDNSDSQFIDVFPTEPNTNRINDKDDINKVFTQFSVVAAKHQNKKYGKPNYLLTKIGSGLTSDLDVTNPIKTSCIFIDTNEHNCFINKFSETPTSDYKNQSFVLSDQVNDQVLKDMYYLISFDSSTYNTSWTSEILSKNNKDLSLTIKHTKDQVTTEIPVNHFYFAVKVGDHSNQKLIIL